MAKRLIGDGQGISPLEEICSAYVKMLLSSEQLPLYKGYDLEQLGIQYVKDGDVEAARELFKQKFYCGVKNSGTYAPDALKNMEYKCIVCITLTARAAIESGLNVQGAYAIRNSLFQRAAAASTVEEYSELCYEAFISFAGMINYARETASEDPRVNQVKEFIRNNISEKLNIGDIARFMNMNKDHLMRIFKESEGLTIKEYIIDTRVKIAESLLCYSECTLSEVSAAAGFTSQSHFGQTFKSKTGLTPAEYRRTNKKIYA